MSHPEDSGRLSLLHPSPLDRHSQNEKGRAGKCRLLHPEGPGSRGHMPRPKHRSPPGNTHSCCWLRITGQTPPSIRRLETGPLCWAPQRKEKGSRQRKETKRKRGNESLSELQTSTNRVGGEWGRKVGEAGRHWQVTLFLYLSWETCKSKYPNFCD